MRIFTEINRLQSALQKYRQKGEKIGLVPTMGALHNGHASLINNSLNNNDLTVCSIFVNPIQFNNKSDLEKYPRNFRADQELLEKWGCQFLFMPSPEEMYPRESRLQFHFGKMERVMEGKFRKGHFNGVGIVVNKLLNIVKPDKAYFGQKDLQQFVIIQAMVEDLNMDVELVSVPIVREKSGLAISSRNQRLTSRQKKIASNLHKALEIGRDLLRNGRAIPVVKREVEQFLGQWQEICLEYFEVVDKQSLKFKKKLVADEEIALCLAAYLGDVRLIDNMIFKY